MTLALCVFAATLAGRDPRRLSRASASRLQAAVIAVMGAAGVAIAGLQLKGATEIAAGVAVFMAITRLPLQAGVAIGGAVTVALAVVTAIAGSSSSAVAAGTLVTVLLGRRRAVPQAVSREPGPDRAAARTARGRARRAGPRGGDRRARPDRERAARRARALALRRRDPAAGRAQARRPRARRRRVSATRSTAPASSSRPGSPTPAKPSERCAATRYRRLAQLPSLIDSYRGRHERST